MAGSDERIGKAYRRAQQLLAAGDRAAAIGELGRLIAKAPKFFDAWFLLGQARGMSGDHLGASQCFARATALDPRHADAWLNRAVSLSALGQWQDAAACCRNCLTITRGRQRAAQLQLAACQLELGDAGAAAASLRDALAVLGEDAELQQSLGIALQSRGELGDALAAYRAAEALGLRNYTLALNRGTCLQALGLPLAAAEGAREALQFQPGDAVAAYNLGVALLELGEVEQAIATLRACPLPRAGIARLNALNYLDDVDGAALCAEHREWGLRQAANAVVRDPPRSLDGRRIRLGFVSPDFRQHPVAFFIEPLLAALDRNRVELVLYCDAACADQLTARIRGHADLWRETADLGDEALAQIIAADGIDLLFDLAGHTSGRVTLFARRLAPVQASYLGYAATSGLATVDYFLSDCRLDPEGGDAEVHYVERLCRLGECFATYAPPAAAPAPAQRPADAPPTLASFARLNKIGAATLALWAETLAAVPKARLLVIGKGLASEAEQARFRERLGAAGIGPARVDLRPALDFEAYLAAHAEVDLFLDTQPWSAHTTALHGLWMGVPTVTVRGRHHAGRFCEMVLRHVGLESLIAPTATEFAETVRAALAQPDLLAQLRVKTRPRLAASPLCDHGALARRFEDACRAMLKAAREGRRDAIRVD